MTVRLLYLFIRSGTCPCVDHDRNSGFVFDLFRSRPRLGVDRTNTGARFLRPNRLPKMSVRIVHPPLDKTIDSSARFRSSSVFITESHGSRTPRRVVREKPPPRRRRRPLSFDRYCSSTRSCDACRAKYRRPPPRLSSVCTCDGRYTVIGRRRRQRSPVRIEHDRTTRSFFVGTIRRSRTPHKKKKKNVIFAKFARNKISTRRAVEFFFFFFLIYNITPAER